MRLHCVALALHFAALFSHAEPPRLPRVLDPALRLEALCFAPDIEAPTTVVGAPDGSFYVGCDPRDARLSTDKPECYIVRYSSMGAEKKRTVFADKIFSPAGSAWFDGWLYVSHDPFLTRFRDTDGDGIADKREDLITNLGKRPDTGLNDHLASGFTLGMDGFVYMSIGDRGTYQTRSVKDGSTISLQGGGIIRFRPDGTALEVFSSGTRNHLAVCLDAEDNAFTLDNTDDGNGWWTRLTHHIEGGYYGYPYDYQHAANYGVTLPSRETLDALRRNGHELVSSVQKSVFGGKSTDDAPNVNTEYWPLNTNFLPALTDFGGGSPTGGLCYLSDGLPEPYRGKLLFSEWGKGGVFVIEVVRDGATFRFVKNTPLIQGGDGIDFRPMQLSVANDGSLLIADWQWGGWKGPKTVGAVWRLSWPEAKIAPRLKDEGNASIEDLATVLGHPDRDQRLRAELELVKKGENIIPKLATLFGDVHDVGVLRTWHAIWILENIMGAVCLDFPKRYTDQRAHVIDTIQRLITAAGRGEEPALHAQAMRALAYRRTWFDCEVVAELAQQLHSSPDAAVRLQAVLAMGRMGYDNLPPLIVKLLGDPDPWVRFAAQHSLGKIVALYGLAAHDLDTREFAKPTLPDEVWQTFERLRLGEPIKVSPTYELTKLEDLWSNQQDIIEFVAKRVSGKLGAAPTDRTRAAMALGHLAYKPKPWSGHWWGTQPVKTAPLLNSVAWEGTMPALEALTAALGDAEAEVRLAAAKAFSNFTMPASAAPERASAPAAKPIPCDTMALSGSAEAIMGDAEVIMGDAEVILGRAEPIMGDAESIMGGAEAIMGDAETITGGAGLFLVAAVETLKAAETALGETMPPVTEAALVSRALATLRSRLGVETVPAVRRQLIEALGVQKDAGAMAVLTGIALDEKADAEVRETAIAAVVGIGGEAARKTIAQLAGAALSPAATRQIIQAAGELKVIEAAPALLARLAEGRTGDREAAAKALAQIGPRSGATDGLIAALLDADAKVQTAAVEALGSLKEKRALPALLEFSKMKRARRETIAAVAALGPDTRALPFLVDALREKGSGERRSALMALKKMRAEAWPMIEQNLASGRIPSEFAPEIRAAFASGVMAKWRVVGPFENVWEAVHPPETDALAGGAFLTKQYVNAEGRESGWNEVGASADEGRVNLEKVFQSNGMVCAYAFAEIESPAEADARLFCGSDDQIAVWLNGKKVHDSGPGSRSLNVDQDEVPLHFAKGRNALLLKIGNVGGGWEFAARIPGVEGSTFTPATEPAPDVRQRAFALAAKPDGSWLNRGDAKRGEKLFFDPAASLGGVCASCHKVRGMGKEVGPDLSLVGSIYQRGEFIVSILEPSKTIALGFEQNVIETTGGETFTGALRQETGEAFTLTGVDGQPHVILKRDVKTRRPLDVSLMPPGLTLGLKPEDFADLLAFLETLK